MAAFLDKIATTFSAIKGKCTDLLQVILPEDIWHIALSRMTLLSYGFTLPPGYA